MTRISLLASCLAVTAQLLHPAVDAQQSVDPLAAHIMAADEAWNERASDLASPELQGRGIEHLEGVLELDPGHIEARWKLSRALYFLGEYGTEDPEQRMTFFTKGRDLTEETLDLIAQDVGDREALDALSLSELAQQFRSRPAVARVYLWGAIQWGLWGRETGPISAARQGVASRIRDYAAAVIALDPGYEAGGGHRVLGRLHAEAPKVPFFTGWIDRDTAVAELKLAIEVAPDDFFNRLYYAEALIDFRPDQKQEGVERLDALLSDTPSGDNRVEEAHVLELARARKAKL